MTIGELFYSLGFKVKDGDVAKVNSEIYNLKKIATKALGMLGIGFSAAAVTGFVKDCVALSSEVEEMQNKFNVVFTGMNDTVEEWAKDYADSIGRSKEDIKTYLADIQNLMVGFMGTDKRQEAYDLTKSMTTLALDLASFNNIDENIAVNAMQKAVLGESEAAKTIGAVLNDVTRAEAMATLGLKGKYQSLDQTNKMLVNYHAILAQSPDAVGDCERSLGSYRSTLIAFQSALKDVKILVGQTFMPTAQKLISLGTKGVRKLRDIMQSLKDMEDACGGVIKAITMVGGAFAAAFLVTNWSKILTSIIGLFYNLEKGVWKVNFKMIALIAVFVLIALVVEDFIGFLQGKDSLFGNLLEKAGVDTDKLRDKLKALIDKVKQALVVAKDFAKDLWGKVGGTVKKMLPIIGDFASKAFGKIGDIIQKVSPHVIEFAEKAGGKLLEFIEGIVPLIGEFASGFGGLLLDSLIQLLPLFQDLGSTVLPLLLEALAGILPLVIQIAESVFPALLDVLGQILPLVLDVAEMVLPAVLDLIAQLLPLALSFIEEVLPVATELIGQILPLVTQIIQDVLPIFVDLIDDALSILGPILDIFADLAVAILPAFVDALGLVEPLLTLVLDAFQPIADIVSVIVDGLSRFIELVSTGITKGAELWKSNGGLLGLFSGGEKGADVPGHANGSEFTEDAFVAGERGPELITGQRGKKVFTALQTGSIVSNLKDTIRSIRSVKGELSAVFNGVANNLNAFANLQTVSPATSTVVTGGSTSNTRNIHQSVSISNTFQGEKAFQRHAATAMDRSANDITRELARGLAYAR